MKKKLKWLKFFETAKFDKDSEQLPIAKRIKRFKENFKYQPLQYRIVWTIRLIGWILVCMVAFVGAAIQIINFIK